MRDGLLMTQEGLTLSYSGRGWFAWDLGGILPLFKVGGVGWTIDSESKFLIDGGTLLAPWELLSWG